MNIIRARLYKVFILAFILLSHSGFSQEAKEKLRLFIIGNSFSVNASKFLPQLAKEGGYNVEIGRAELGGCPLEKHWSIAEAYEANSNDSAGKAYGGKSLKMLLSNGKWDVVTIQQYSRFSGFVDTYRPYAKKLYDYIKSIQPDAKIVIHQTWAYRSDANGFGLIGKDIKASTDKEMYEKSRAAYHTIADELNVEIIPTGDAFYKLTSDPEWAFKKDTKFNYTNPVYPATPNDIYSLHAGYKWDKDKKLVFDANHASVAGEFLGSLVWYNFLFNQSPIKLDFKPERVSEKFAKRLKKVAASTVGKKEMAYQ